eukprot:scaffold320983_cov18-Tisochrysis_lutea.AAC.1
MSGLCTISSWGGMIQTFDTYLCNHWIQALTFELWDADVIGGDDFVGNCSLPLINLEPMKPTNLSLPLNACNSSTA